MCVLLVLLILLPGIRRVGDDSAFVDPFSKDQTQSLKGLLALLVMMHHLCTYLDADFPSLLLFEDAGFVTVGGFFLISGYGLCHSALENSNYLSNFFRRRILALLITYYVTDVLYILMKLRIMPAEKVAQYALKSIFGVHFWFVPVMILLYVLFYAAFRFFGKKSKTRAAVALSVMVLLYVAFSFALHKLYNITSFGRWWYNSAPCFLVGIWYRMLRDRIMEFISRHYTLLCSVSIVLFATLYIFSIRSSPAYTYDTLMLVLEILSSSAFCVLIILLSVRYRIGNSLLRLLGKLSFELYLIHALLIAILRWDTTPLTLFGHTLGFDLYITSSDLYLAGVLVASLAVSYVIHILSGKIFRYVCRK